jgi:uncharacterized protein YndB with AHSA1/START domain
MTSAESIGRSGQTFFETPSDFEFSATRVFDAPRWLVWEAWTCPSHLLRWLLGPVGWTLSDCQIDLRTNGKWRFVWAGPSGDEMTARGEFIEVLEPKRLVFTESWGARWPDTLNTVVFEQLFGKTQVVTTVLYPSEADRAAALGTGLKGIWSKSHDRLDAYLPMMILEQAAPGCFEPTHALA